MTRVRRLEDLRFGDNSSIEIECVRNTRIASHFLFCPRSVLRGVSGDAGAVGRRQDRVAAGTAGD